MMRPVGFLSLAMLALVAAAPPPDITRDEFAARRDALRKALPGAVVVLEGGNESDRGALRTGFLQEPNFLYFTGWREPGALLMITPSGDTLFLPKRNPVRERYTGKKVAPGDADTAQSTGFANVRDVADFPDKLKEAVAAGADTKVYALAADAPKLKQILSAGREILSAVRPIARLRMVKSPAELARIQRSVDATIDAHLVAWRRAEPGLYEYQIAATMTGSYFERGCERHAYAPIVASGPNAIVLHYSANSRRMDSGELLLMDVGAECADYAADITRTIPVNGKFNARQREIYEIVLGAQNAAIAAAKPGMKLLGMGEDSLNGIARKYIDTHGKDKHGESLVKYYLHQLGHHVGLEVHDATDPDVTLAPGMVFTIEPGIYIAEENIGVRIEDVVLITDKGARVLSDRLPRDPREIEKRLR